MSMHRTELVNMIKVVRSFGFPESPNSSTIFQCFVTTKVARDKIVALSECQLLTSPEGDEAAREHKRASSFAE